MNPAMGWLFAVGLGMQQERRSAVLAALAPLALGHAVSVGLVLLVLGGARVGAPARIVTPAAATALVAFGLFRLAGPGPIPAGSACGSASAT